MAERPKRIPITAAKRVAEEYGYDQVLVYARKTGEPGGEHMTTYGVNKTHCSIAAAMADRLQRFMGWKTDASRTP